MNDLFDDSGARGHPKRENKKVLKDIPAAWLYLPLKHARGYGLRNKQTFAATPKPPIKA